MKDDNGTSQLRDVLLMEKVGHSLQKMLESLPRESPLCTDTAHKVRSYLQGIVCVTEPLHSVGLVWNADFHSGNVCFSMASQSWKMVDL